MRWEVEYNKKKHKRCLYVTSVIYKRFHWSPNVRSKLLVIIKGLSILKHVLKICEIYHKKPPLPTKLQLQKDKTTKERDAQLQPTSEVKKKSLYSLFGHSDQKCQIQNCPELDYSYKNQKSLCNSKRDPDQVTPIWHIYTQKSVLPKLQVFWVNQVGRRQQTRYNTYNQQPRP